MMRAFATLAIAGLVGYAVLKVVFGMMGGVFAMLLGLFFLLLKLALFAGAVYFIVSIFSPETARKMRSAAGFDRTEV
jgi:uncharacterized membrane protein